MKVDLTVEGEGAGGYGRTGGYWHSLRAAGESLARSGSTWDSGAGDGAVRRISGHAPVSAFNVLAGLNDRNVVDDEDEESLSPEISMGEKALAGWRRGKNDEATDYDDMLRMEPLRWIPAGV